MKVIASTLLLFILFVPFQKAEGQVFNAGIKAGFNSNRFVTNSTHFNSSDTKFGFAGGIFLRIKSGVFSFQPEATFSNRTGMIPYSSVQNGIDTFIYASMNNIDFPLIVNLHFGNVFRIGTGPVFSYNVAEKISYNTSNNKHNIAIEKDVFKASSYSWQFAAGLEIRRWVFDVRYEVGIDKLNYKIDIPGQSFSLEPELYNRTWQFTLGFKIINP